MTAQSVSQPPVLQPPKIASGIQKTCQATEVSPPPVERPEQVEDPLSLNGEDDYWISNRLLGFLGAGFLTLAILLATCIHSVLQSESHPLVAQQTQNLLPEPVNPEEIRAETTRETAWSVDVLGNSIGSSRPAQAVPAFEVPSIEPAEEIHSQDSLDNLLNEQIRNVIMQVGLIENKPLNRTDLATKNQKTDATPLLISALTPTSKNQKSKTLPSEEKALTKKPSISAPFYGTKIAWKRRIDDAAALAKEENKLVFLIHVSGNFTQEEFT